MAISIDTPKGMEDIKEEMHRVEGMILNCLLEFEQASGLEIHDVRIARDSVFGCSTRLRTVELDVRLGHAMAELDPRKRGE